MFRCWVSLMIVCICIGICLVVKVKVERHWVYKVGKYYHLEKTKMLTILFVTTTRYVQFVTTTRYVQKTVLIFGASLRLCSNERCMLMTIINVSINCWSSTLQPHKLRSVDN